MITLILAGPPKIWRPTQRTPGGLCGHTSSCKNSNALSEGCVTTLFKIFCRTLDQKTLIDKNWFKNEIHQTLQSRAEIHQAHHCNFCCRRFFRKTEEFWLKIFEMENFQKTPPCCLQTKNGPWLIPVWSLARKKFWKNPARKKCSSGPCQ